MLDGKPIVAIATTESSNRKTGDMIQTWILRKNIDPVKAVRNGYDKSICGNCYHRGTVDRPRTCYVNVGQAPLSVFRGYKRGCYSRGRLPTHKPVRMGAYGDPVAVPWQAWEGIHEAPLWTGYTHQWRQLIAHPFRNVLMASCDGTAEAAEAAAAGWRAFVVSRTPTGVLCPSNRGTQCAECGLCSGLQRPSAPNIYIEPHGTSARFVEA